MLKSIINIATLLALTNKALCDYPKDRVYSLPYMATFDFPVYSGYIEVPHTSKSLHYMFAQSQSDPTNDPLIIWFNGGPGCSSMLGFLQEHGPYVMDDNTTYFHYNNYSWNLQANMLYIEAPAGVGYSFCQLQSECSFTDDQTADDNLNALVYFFQEKFPEFASHDLYIAGESYAGVYVPYLVYYIDQYNNKTQGSFKFNLKGFIVGNGVTNWKWDGDPTYVPEGFYHGLYSYKMRQDMISEKCDYYYEDIAPNDSANCVKLFGQFTNLTTDINSYDLYRPCFYYNASQQVYGTAKVGDQIKTYKKVYSTKDYTPWLFNHPFKGENLADDSLPPCIFGVPIIDYLNSGMIRRALHIPDDVHAWELCTDAINYTSGYNASQWIYPLVKGKYKILFYSGDTDGSVPTYGSQMWMNDLGWNITEKWRSYNIGDGQVAGFVTQRDGNFTFGTVHGCGHMAPQWKRAQTYHLVFNWLFGKAI